MRLICVLGTVALGVGCHREDPWPAVPVTLEEIGFAHPMLEAMTRRMVSHAEGQGLVGTGWVREGYYVVGDWCSPNNPPERCGDHLEISKAGIGDAVVHIAGDLASRDPSVAPQVTLLRIRAIAVPAESRWGVVLETSVSAVDGPNQRSSLGITYFQVPVSDAALVLDAGKTVSMRLTQGTLVRGEPLPGDPIAGLSMEASRSLGALRTQLRDAASLQAFMRVGLASVCAQAQELARSGDLEVHQTRLLVGPPEGWRYDERDTPAPALPESLPGYALEFEERCRAMRGALTVAYKDLYSVLLKAVPPDLADPP